MFVSILVTAVLTAALALAFRGPAEDRMIRRRPYNNPYSDASAARDR